MNMLSIPMYASIHKLINKVLKEMNSFFFQTEKYIPLLLMDINQKRSYNDYIDSRDCIDIVETA